MGVTLLVCLTGRPAVRDDDDIFDAVENDFKQIFGEIAPSALAEAEIGWPEHVCQELVPLVLSTEKEPSLCNPKKFKRLPLAEALETVARLETRAEEAQAAVGATSAASSGPAAALRIDHRVVSDTSKLVREIGRKATGYNEAAERQRRLQQKASEGFQGLMTQLEHANTVAAAEAPLGFEDKLKGWRDRHAISEELHDWMQTLRIWRNAFEHGDDARWRSQGPRDEKELATLIGHCVAAVTQLEERRKARAVEVR